MNAIEAVESVRRRARRLWPVSLRRQLIAGVALVHLLLMTVFVFDLVNRQRAFLTQLSLDHTLGLARTLAINSSSWVLANDVVGLEEIVGSVARYPDLRYAMITDPEGKVLAHTDPARVGSVADDPESRSLRSGARTFRVLRSDRASVDVAVPVLTADGDLVGWARVGRGGAQIAANLSAAWSSGVLYTLLAILTGSVFALLIGRRLASGLERLLAFSGEIRDGRRDLRLTAEGDDEISRLGAGINEMLDALLLVESEKSRLRDFTESLIQTANVIFVQLDEDGRVRRLNQEAEKAVGWRQGELEGKDWFETAIPPDERARVREEFRRLARAGERANVFENPILTRAGERRAVMWQNGVVKDGDRLVGTISFGIDVTERARDAARLAQVEAQLRQAQKLESVGRLAGGVAHDFNNILMAILGYAESLKQNLPYGDPRQKDAEEIILAGERAAALTRQLLAFSRRQPLVPSLVDLNATVTNLQRMLQRLLGEDVEIVCDLAAGLGKVLADHHLIEQVVLNLVVNARDAMPKGGRLTLRTRDVETDAAQAGARPGPYVVLEVADTGVGMDAETLARVFEPFFTTKAVGKGTGLGLSTVYGIVQQSGGRVEVSSTPGAGSCFRVFLPRAAADAVVAAPPAPPRVGGEARGRILLVEDDETVRRIVGRLLRQEGHAVVEAKSGLEALAAVRESPERLDLMITDLVMPGIDGVELAGLVRGLRPAMRILYMSGYTEKKALDAADAFIQKPFAMKALAQKVQELLAPAASSAPKS
ncbi:MAG: response regulator [Elusimicrobia bacterium]|nr:response regulator [Elusimicrobiota bacterium]